MLMEIRLLRLNKSDVRGPKGPAQRGELRSWRLVQAGFPRRFIRSH